MNSLNKSLEYILSSTRLRTHAARKARVPATSSPLSLKLKKQTRIHRHKVQSLQPLLKHIDQERLNIVLSKRFPGLFPYDIARKDFSIFLLTLARDDHYERIHRFLVEVYTVANRMSLDLLSRLKTELPSTKLSHIRDTNRRVNRSLLLYQYAPHIFRDILDVDAYEPPKDRRSALRCSSYTTIQKTKHNRIDGFDDRVRMDQFKHAMSSIVFCPVEHIETEISETAGSLKNMPVYDVTILYLESVCDATVDNRLDFYSESHQRKALYITYYMSSGLIEIFSSASRIRFDAARCFLKAFGECGYDDLSHILYNIKHLANFIPLPMNSPEALWAKVTQLTYIDNGRKTSWSIDVHDPINIYDTIQHSYQGCSVLAKVIEASITLKMNSKCNNRYTRIDLLGTHTCQIVTACDQDRWLCHNLLEHWGLITRTSHAAE